MKTLTDLLSELRLLDAAAAVADKLPQTVRSASLTIYLPAEMLEGVHGAVPSLDRDGSTGEMCVRFWGDVRIGRLTVQVYASRPATTEDVLARLPSRNVVPAVASAREVRVCDETAGVLFLSAAEVE